MRVRVLLFAGARDLAGTAELSLDLPEAARAGDVPAHRRLLALAPLAGVLRIAVNEEFSGPERALEEGDTVALLPPVSGG